jgi:predicted small secreted protein
MIAFTKRLTVSLLLTSIVVFVGIGCNTAHGFGKDVEKAGTKIQDGTK